MQYLDPKEVDRNFEHIKSVFVRAEKTWVFNRDIFWEYLKILPNDGKALELGCGSGWFAERLISKYGFKDFVLADLDDYRTFAKQLPFIKNDFSFEKLPFSDNTFDVVFTIQTIEHLENSYNFLREIDRVVKPGGWLVIAMPNGWNIYSRLKFLFRNKIESFEKTDYKKKIFHNHINFLTRDIFLMCLKRFTIVKRLYLPRKRISFWWFAKFRFPHPNNEFFSSRLCYFMKKNEN